MTRIKKYMIQVLAEGTWHNYGYSTTMEKAIRISMEELTGYKWRIIGYHNEHWIECLISGSMLSVENKDFRILTA